MGGDPGNAILPNGVLPTANLEIGVPGFRNPGESDPECRPSQIKIDSEKPFEMTSSKATS
jgi:hypothetical protein